MILESFYLITLLDFHLLLTHRILSLLKKKKKKKKKKYGTQGLKQKIKGNLPPYYHRERQAPLALLYIE
jgi:hypothetical protein